MAVLTVEYKVGVKRQTALVRLYNQVFQNRDLWPPGLGVGEPMIRAMGIDDVPVLTLALWTDDEQRGPVELLEVAHTLEAELKQVQGTRDVYTVGGPDRAVVVELDAARLAAHGLTMDDVAASLAAANTVLQAGRRVAAASRRPASSAGLAGASE